MLKRIISLVLMSVLLVSNAYAYDFGEITSEDYIIEKVFSDFKNTDESYVTREDCLVAIMKTIGFTEETSYAILNTGGYTHPFTFGDVYWDNGYLMAAGYHKIALGGETENGVAYFYPERPATVKECIAFITRCIADTKDLGFDELLTVAEKKGIITDKDDFYNNIDEVLTKETFSTLLKRMLNKPVYYHFKEGGNAAAWRVIKIGYAKSKTYYAFLRNRYNSPKPFSTEASVYGYKNPKGEIVIEPQFTEAYKFYDGYAAVQTDGYYTYIDENGGFVTDKKFGSAGTFENGYAIVSELENPQRYGVIDKNFNMVIPCAYDSLDHVAIDEFEFELGNIRGNIELKKYGVIAVEE